MEDILASIKRIIAEDSEAVGARPAKLRRDAIEAVTSSPILAKKRRALPVDDVVEPEPEPAGYAAAFEDEEASSYEPEAETALAGQAADEADAGATDDADPVIQAAGGAAEAEPAPDVLELTSPMPEADSAPDTESPAAPSASPVAQKAGSERESGLLSSPAAQASRDAFATLSQLQVRAENGQSNTLEGLVADMLRPMLREWLDRELPALVERLVSAEVARLSGRN